MTTEEFTEKLANELQERVSMIDDIKVGHGDNYVYFDTHSSDEDNLNSIYIDIDNTVTVGINPGKQSCDDRTIVTFQRDDDQCMANVIEHAMHEFRNRQKLNKLPTQ